MVNIKFHTPLFLFRQAFNIKKTLFFKYPCLFFNQYLVKFNEYNVEIDKKQIKYVLSSGFIISLYFLVGCPNAANPDDIF